MHDKRLTPYLRSQIRPLSASASIIEWRDPYTLKPYSGNPRTHSPTQIEQIVRSIQHFGFTNPVLIDANDGIIAGHGRVAAAKLLGMPEVPTLKFEHLSCEEIRAYIIADNRLAELADWDKELLALELQFLSTEDLNFDVTLTGFELPEIDNLICGLTPDDEAEEEDQIIQPDYNAPPVTRSGDLWRIGNHRLICADATDPETFARLMGDERARMVITDPPYNVPIDGHVSGNGRIKHRDFQMASGEMSPAAFTSFLKASCSNLVNRSLDGALHYVFMDWRHMREILDASEGIYSELKNVCVWAKTNGGLGSLYRSQHEFVFVFKAGRGPHINNVSLGKYGRNRTNLWTYAGVNVPGADRLSDLSMHPTVKPQQLVSDAIMDASHRGDVVLDAFVGSGTTLLAAEKTGRRGYGVEIDPHYVDVAIKRLRETVGLVAVHAESGKTFDEIASERAEEN